MNVLVLDDSLYMLKYYEAVFRKYRSNTTLYTHLTYEDSVTCIHTHDIDVAIIDLNMEGKNGADFIEYMSWHEKFSKIKKVVVTETGKNTLLETSLANRVDAYLHKEEVFDDFKTILVYV